MTPSLLITLVAVGAAAIAAGILLWYLFAKPPFTRTTLVVLFFGLGVFPVSAALLGNMKGFEVSKNVEFCGGCHVMQPWIDDVTNPEATTLASFHTKSPLIKDIACYECHADYGMYGTVVTKWQGTKHMYAYYADGYSGMESAEAIKKIALYEPFPNSNCMHCHSTQLQGWNDEPEHMAVADDVRAGTTGCASEGCHGPAHGVKTEEGAKTAELRREVTP